VNMVLNNRYVELISEGFAMSKPSEISST